MAGDPAILGGEMENDGLEIGVLGDDVEESVRVGGELASEFEREDKIERISSHDFGLDDAELVRVLLGKEGDFHREFVLMVAQDEKDEGIFSSKEGKIRHTDVFVIDEDVLGASHGGVW